ncbi:hypothetical protein [Rhodopirellula halodulae]|uniref:hypothetical protein n=1 Tax=Rhodopirellula halodulae TaxID=2894198 RepID=UPI001E479BE0|nr:hypothetical protein [Rhodopirellula sp. JC737]MCC9657967.1 hypothetical protein [Rhodopirellula sp. JC737]
MKVHRENDVYSTLHITGPTYVSLKLTLASAPVDDFPVDHVESQLRTPPTADVVRIATTAGAARANAKYDVTFFPAHVRCDVDHYRPESILDHLTFKIVEYAAISRFAARVQQHISDSPLTYNKLAAECGVAKSVLYTIAKSGAFTGVEQKDAVTLIEHFHLHTGG